MFLYKKVTVSDFLCYNPPCFGVSSPNATEVGEIHLVDRAPREENLSAEERP